MLMKVAWESSSPIPAAVWIMASRQPTSVSIMALHESTNDFAGDSNFTTMPKADGVDDEPFAGVLGGPISVLGPTEGTLLGPQAVVLDPAFPAFPDSRSEPGGGGGGGAVRENRRFC